MFYFFQDTIKVLDLLYSEHKINSIGYNLDYTPYAKYRDQLINGWCEKHHITRYCEEDYPLYQIIGGMTRKPTTNTPYLVFTPFKKYCMKNLSVTEPATFHNFKFNPTNIKNKFSILSKDIHSFYQPNQMINIRGGRKNGLLILNNMKKWEDYNHSRDYLEYKTTFLSAHLHFGTISIREAYHRILKVLGIKNGLINELHWRDFYINITYYYPKILEGQIGKTNKPLKDKYNHMKWNHNKLSDNLFKSWCEGRTGFPIVDAAITQLNTTGYMHNRCRMIVACFLCKDLLIDWRKGEQYFASKLIDYDPMSNSGGWQWCASVGADSQPYFRIFNPWSQQKKFDPECHYIKRWLPELKDLAPKIIHEWYAEHTSYSIYYKPIVDHSMMRKKALAIYKNI